MTACGVVRATGDPTRRPCDRPDDCDFCPAIAEARAGR